MKKGILKFTAFLAGLLLTVGAILLCVSQIGGQSVIKEARAAEHVDHCECGGTGNGVGDHTCAATKPTWVGVSTSSELLSLEGLGSAPSSPKEYWVYLKNDITLTKSMAFYSSGTNLVTLHLCLNGYVLSGPTNSRVIHGINGVFHMTICDCGDTGAVKAVGGCGSASSTIQGGNILLYKSGTTLKLYGGTITEGCAKNNFGGNIAVANGSTFYMYGGCVSFGLSHEKDLANTASKAPSYYGGNVALTGSSKFYMYDGLIEAGCVYNGNGGNVAVMTGSQFTMYGGMIHGGSVYGGGGGNIYVKDSTCSFTMEGGTISEGTATVIGTGGGFGGNIATNGLVTMNDGTIEGGFADGNIGGNVAMWNTTGQFIMNGGKIRNGYDSTRECGGIAAFYQATKEGVITLNGGTVTNNVGGITIKTGSLYISGAPTVSGNTDSDISGVGKSYIKGTLTGGELVFNDTNYVCYSDTDYSQYIKCRISQLTTVYDATEGTHKFQSAFFQGDLANRKIDIYIVAGQSNASGSTSFESASSATVRDGNVYENVFYYEKRYDTTGALIRDKSGYAPVHEGLGFADNYIGPELGIARIINDDYTSDNKKALIIKTAYGATSVTFHQNDEGIMCDVDGNVLSSSELERQTLRGSWYPECLQNDVVKAMGDMRPTGFQLREAIKMVTNVYNQLLAAGYKAENISFKSINWMQGETDRVWPEEYKTIFPLTVKEYRDAISALTGDDYSDLRLVVGEICSSFSSATPASCAKAGDFIAMQNELPDVISNTVVIPTKGFAQNKMVNGASVECGTDNCHWNYDDMLQIGEMFGKASAGLTFSQHTHCYCNGFLNGVGGHVCENYVWIPISSAEDLTSLRGIGGTTIEAGTTKNIYAYLTKNVELYSVMQIADGVKFYLCTSEYEMTYQGDTHCLEVLPGAYLYVTECEAGTTETFEYTYKAADHTHCECGGVRNGVGDHVCSTETITWTKMTTSDDLSGLPGIGGTALAAGTQVEYYLYLANDVTLAKSMSIVDGVKLHICLNGFTLTGANNQRLFFVNNGADVTVCDCSAEETGVMKCRGSVGSGTSTPQGQGFCLYSASTTSTKRVSLKWYGGTLRDGKTNLNFGGNIALCSLADFMMYGGTITAGSALNDVNTTAGSGGNIGVSGTNAKITIYAGTVSDGYAGSFGGNISGTNATVKILGGTITGGNAKWGGNIAFASTTGKDNLFKDVTISNGKARGSYAGNIGIYDGTNLTLAGNTVVTGGTCVTFGGNIYVKGDTKKGTLTIQDNVIIENGKTGTSSTAHGGNIAVSGYGCVVMTGGIVRGGSSYCGGNIAMGDYSTSKFCTGFITISGGLIQNGIASANGWDIQNQTSSTGTITLSDSVVVENTVSHSGGGSINTGKSTAKIVINGGTYKCSRIMCTTGEIDITDGYFPCLLTNYTYTYKFAVSGGYFVNSPAKDRLVDGYVDVPVTEVKDGVTYNYHIMKGYHVTTTSRTESSSDPVATTTGGNAVEEGGSIQLAAPATVGGYSFKGWYTEYPGTPVSTENIFVATNVQADTTYIAVYEFSGENLILRVAGSTFQVKVGDSAAVDGMGMKSMTVATGATVTVTYTGPAFLCWKNNVEKVVSKEASYTFTMYTDTDLIVENSSENAAMTVVIFYNDSNQIIQTTQTGGPLDADVIPEVPIHPGYTGGQWDKTLEEINAAVADSETTLVEVHAVGYVGATLFEALEESEVPQIEMTQRIVSDQTEETKKTLTFGATRNVPEGYTLIEQGFVLTSMKYVSTKEAAKEVLFLGSKKASKLVCTSLEASDISYLNLRNVESYCTVYVVGYMVCLKDGEQEPIVYYTNVNVGKTTGITE